MWGPPAERQDRAPGRNVSTLQDQAGHIHLDNERRDVPAVFPEDGATLQEAPEERGVKKMEEKTRRPKCPNCVSRDVRSGTGGIQRTCRKCGYVWWEWKNRGRGGEESECNPKTGTE